MDKRPVVALALFAFLALLFVQEQVQSRLLGEAVSLTRQEMRRQEQTNAHLRMRLALLRSPERIARQAQSRLQMTPPSPESQVILGSAVERTGSSLGILSLLR